MSAQAMQLDAAIGCAGQPSSQVPSFLQLSFNLQLLDRAGAPATAARHPQHAAKSGQQQTAAAQRPPLPPSTKASAPQPPAPEQPEVQLQLKQQKQAGEAANSDGQQAPSQPPQGPHFAMTPSLQTTAAASAAAEQAAEQNDWAHRPGVAPGVDPAFQQQQSQQHAQQYPQYEVQYAAMAAGQAAGLGPEHAAYDSYQVSYCEGGYGTAGQASYADDGVSGRPRASRGRGKGRSRRATSSEPHSEADEAYTERQQHQPAAKRWKKEQPPLEAESQLLLLGFLSAVVGDNAMLEQCLVHAVSFETQQEAMLQQQRMMGAAEAMQQPSNKVGVLKQYQLAQSLAKNVRSRAGLSHVWQLPLAFSSARR